MSFPPSFWLSVNPNLTELDPFEQKLPLILGHFGTRQTPKRLQKSRFSTITSEILIL